MHLSKRTFLRIYRTFQQLKAGEVLTTKQLLTVSRTTAKLVKQARGTGLTFDPGIKSPERAMSIIKGANRLAEMRLDESAILAQFRAETEPVRYVEFVQLGKTLVSL